MEMTAGQETILAQYRTSMPGVVKLFWTGSVFKTQQDFDDDGTAVIELADPLNAFLHYEYARSTGLLWRPFPVPVAEESEPSVKRAPALLSPAEARRIRCAAGVSPRQVDELAHLTAGTAERWERHGISEWTVARYPKNVARYVQALAAIARGKHGLKTPAPAPTDGKRRCNHPGCITVLSRFNDGDRCACHA